MTEHSHHRVADLATASTCPSDVGLYHDCKGKGRQIDSLLPPLASGCCDSYDTLQTCSIESFSRNKGKSKQNDHEALITCQVSADVSTSRVIAPNPRDQALPSSNVDSSAVSPLPNQPGLGPALPDFEEHFVNNYTSNQHISASTTSAAKAGHSTIKLHLPASSSCTHITLSDVETSGDFPWIPQLHQPSSACSRCAQTSSEAQHGSRNKPGVSKRSFQDATFSPQTSPSRQTQNFQPQPPHLAEWVGSNPSQDIPRYRNQHCHWSSTPLNSDCSTASQDEAFGTSRLCPQSSHKRRRPSPPFSLSEYEIASGSGNSDPSQPVSEQTFERALQQDPTGNIDSPSDHISLHDHVQELSSEISGNRMDHTAPRQEASSRFFGRNDSQPLPSQHEFPPRDVQNSASSSIFSAHPERPLAASSSTLNASQTSDSVPRERPNSHSQATTDDSALASEATTRTHSLSLISTLLVERVQGPPSLPRVSQLSERLAALRSQVDSPAMELERWRARNQQRRQPTSSQTNTEPLETLELESREPNFIATQSTENLTSDRLLGTRQDLAQNQASDSFLGLPSLLIERTRSGAFGEPGRLQRLTQRANESWIGLARDRSPELDDFLESGSVEHTETGPENQELETFSNSSTWDETRRYMRSFRPPALSSSSGSSQQLARQRNTNQHLSPPSPNFRARPPVSLSISNDSRSERLAGGNGDDEFARSAGSSTSAGQTQSLTDLSQRDMDNPRPRLRPFTLSARFATLDGTGRGRLSAAPARLALDDGEDSSNVSPRRTYLSPWNQFVGNNRHMLSAGQEGRRWMQHTVTPPSLNAGMEEFRSEYMRREIDRSTFVQARNSLDQVSRWDERDSLFSRPRPLLDILSDSPASSGDDLTLLDQIAQRRARRTNTSPRHSTNSSNETWQGSVSRSPFSDFLSREERAFSTANMIQESRHSSQVESDAIRLTSFHLSQVNDSQVRGHPPSEDRRWPSRPHLASTPLARLGASLQRNPSDGSRPHDMGSELESALRSLQQTDNEQVPNSRPRLSLERFRELSGSWRIRDRLPDSSRATRTQTPSGIQEEYLAPFRRTAESPFEYLSRILRQENPGTSLPHETRHEIPSRNSGGGLTRDSTLGMESQSDEQRRGLLSSSSTLESFMNMLRSDTNSISADPANYLTDEEWESSSSYEGLLWLSLQVGDAQPKHVPPHIVASLPTCLYSEWNRKHKQEGQVLPETESAVDNKDTHCPICLDEYNKFDTIMWLPDCKHAFHASCLSTWFETAKTCPFCRADVYKDHREM